MRLRDTYRKITKQLKEANPAQVRTFLQKPNISDTDAIALRDSFIKAIEAPTQKDGDRLYREYAELAESIERKQEKSGSK